MIGNKSFLKFGQERRWCARKLVLPDRRRSVSCNSDIKLQTRGENEEKTPIFKVYKIVAAIKFMFLFEL